MKRISVFAALCFAGGIVFAASGAQVYILAAAAAAAAAYTVFIRKSGTAAVLLAFVIMICGIARYNAADRKRAELARRCDGAIKTVKLLVLEQPSDGSFTARADTEYGKLKLRISVENCPKLKPGEYAAARVELTSPLYFHSTGFDYSKYLAGQNIFLTAHAKSAEKLNMKARGISGAAFAVRRYIEKVTDKFFSGDEKGLFDAMICGSKANMSAKLSKAMKNAGLSHVAVVSGMHISVMLSVIMYFICGIFGSGRKGCFAAIFASAFFAAVTGGGASVVRACIMCIVYQAANLLYRERDGYAALSVSVLLMSIYNPFVMMNVGFIFSVLSVLGILMWQKRIAAHLTFCPRSAAEAISLTAAAQLTVLPASAYIFGEAALYSLISNVLTSFFSTAVIILGMVFVLLSAVPVISSAAAFLCGIALKALISVTYAVAALPCADVKIGKIGIVWLCGYYAALLLLFAFPKAWKRLAAAAAVTVPLCFAASAALYNPNCAKIESMPYSVGGSTVVRLPKDKLMLVDCESAYDAERYLRDEGRTSYDCAVQTDNSFDEILKLAESGKIKKLVMPMYLFSGSLTERLEAAEEKYKTETVWLERDSSDAFGGTYICYPFLTDQFEKTAVMRLSFGKTEVAFMRRLQPRDIDRLYDSGVRIIADYILPPNVQTSAENKLSAVACGRFEESGKELVNGKMK